jgi:hypothetical protein
MLLRPAYLAVTNTFSFIRLLPMRDRDENQTCHESHRDDDNSTSATLVFRKTIRITGSPPITHIPVVINGGKMSMRDPSRMKKAR